jgi:hypothetical protein
MELPCRALQLISEYSKPITRPDWRTFPRTITKNIFFYESNNLNEGLYNIVRKNKYDYIYSMSKKKIIDYIYKQNAIIKELEFVEKMKLNNEIQYLLAKNKKSQIRRKVINIRKVNYKN